MAAQGASYGRRKGRLSPAAQGVLALIIERPDYGFGLWKRFDRRFGQLYPLSKPRIYQVVDQLGKRGLVEEMASSTTRQPKILYRATAAGARAHREWIAAGIQEDPRREELIRRLLATGAGDARGMLRIVDIYERGCLDDAARRPEASDAFPRDKHVELRERLIEEERRLQLEARVRFVAFARRHIQAALSRDEGRR